MDVNLTDDVVTSCSPTVDATPAQYPDCDLGGSNSTDTALTIGLLIVLIAALGLILVTRRRRRQRRLSRRGVP